MPSSLFMQKIQEIFASVQGHRLPPDVLQEKTIALAEILLTEAQQIQTKSELSHQAQIAGMIKDPLGKVFTTDMTDQCFRSKDPHRVANQLHSIVRRYGIPQFLGYWKGLGLKTFVGLRGLFAAPGVAMLRHLIRQETATVIVPGEKEALKSHLQRRYKENVRMNLNHLGEAILGEEEAKSRMQIYLDDLANPDIEYVSIKISTICSQLNTLAWEDTIGILSQRLKQLYRAAKFHAFIRKDGTRIPKFVNLDMEEYRDLHLTVETFRRVLEDAEFFQFSAGIVLQAYLPDSHLIQQELTTWAMRRVASGGAPIKIRIVKGANLAMERVESALKCWPQPPYTKKIEVDANFKRMVEYGCQKNHAPAVNLGIGSHNLFDIAYVMLLSTENEVKEFICFEMLEGMADHIRRVVQRVWGEVLLYCPVAKKEEFQNAVAYLVRRLDENTAPENFLSHLFDLKPATTLWKQQAAFFITSCRIKNKVNYLPRRTQNRLTEPEFPALCGDFSNEPDSEWSLPQNRKWIESIVKEWSQKQFEPIPVVVDNTLYYPEPDVPNGCRAAEGQDPSLPGKVLYYYTLATTQQIDTAIEAAQKAAEQWKSSTVDERSVLLGRIAHLMRRQRGDLIGVMIADSGKTVVEADVEISEAIDFAEYYRRNLEEWHNLPQVAWSSKGVVLVTPPWNFPCSIPAGGILAALAAGNTVIFKPAPETVLVGWELAKIFWEAGISRNLLQFITCDDESVGSALVSDPRINAIILTGATATAQLFLKLNPETNLMAETGGKNALIISNMADRDLAIKDLIHSAFGHSGQKCSACSLAVLHAEVYDDPHFMSQLKDAAASLRVGSPWHLATKINPLIHEPQGALLKGLTSLEKGESWLLEPMQDPINPQLWSPGIKLGVKKGSFMHRTELFGPVLGIMRAESLEEAIDLANDTPYGLTSGLHSLDIKEHILWKNSIEAGNCYINRGITGAIVQRQPFGGCKASSFGKGSKAGGPNYLIQLMHAEELGLPEEQAAIPQQIEPLCQIVEKLEWDSAARQKWEASIHNYAFYREHYFSLAHDPSNIIGEDNLLQYRPHHRIALRLQENDTEIDIYRVLAAALTCQTPMILSGEHIPDSLKKLQSAKFKPEQFIMREEMEEAFLADLAKHPGTHVRLLSEPPKGYKQRIHAAGAHLHYDPVSSIGRLELLHYLREMVTSYDYHRYGNLGDREKEPRRSIPLSSWDQASEIYQDTTCRTSPHNHTHTQKECGVPSCCNRN